MNSTNSRIRTLRFKFSLNLFDEKTITKSPFVQFNKWMDDALTAKSKEPNAMTLATVAESGYPDARIVLLRDFNSKGFSFYTNYNSIKGREIRHNKKACINFFWPEIHRQVRIKGIIRRTSEKDSDNYFASRPRESQIGAWASLQSEKITARKVLEDRYRNYEIKFKGKKVPRPGHWGGYLLKPVYFEFWQGQTNRLHDRIIYQKSKDGRWKIERLNP